MLRIVTLLVCLAVGLCLFTWTADAYTCGVMPIKPVIPVGCRDLVPQCTCDSQGRCYWQWVCVR